MDPAALAVSPFVTLLAWSVVLLVVHVALQGFSATLELGSAWNAGPRDEEGSPPARSPGAWRGRPPTSGKPIRPSSVYVLRWRLPVTSPAGA